MRLPLPSWKFMFDPNWSRAFTTREIAVEMRLCRCDQSVAPSPAWISALASATRSSDAGLRFRYNGPCKPPDNFTDRVHHLHIDRISEML